MSKSRNWCFTLNNPHYNLDSIFAENESVSYAVWQLELSPSGTPHFQGYVVFTSPRSLGYCKQRVHARGHFEIRRARTHAQAIAYCCKEDTRLEGPWTYGEQPGDNQGRRTDVIAFKSLIDSGATERAIWDTHPELYLRFGSRIQQIRSLRHGPRTQKTTVILAIGKPGCGKSFAAKRLGEAFGIPQEEIYRKPPNTHWWPGYTGQRMTVLDDFKSWFPWTELMQLLDAYGMQVQTKGGYVEFTSELIYITTNFHPDNWYSENYPMEALFRRIDESYFFELPTTDINGQKLFSEPILVDIANFDKTLLE